MMQILEVIRRCPYCKRESTVSPQSYSENPFCDECLNERVENASSKLGPITYRKSGSYYEIISSPEMQHCIVVR